MNRYRIANGITKYASLVLLSVLVLFMVFPLILITLTSFKSESEYYTNGPLALPQTINLDILSYTWKHTDYTRLLINSTVISVSAAVLAVGISLLNAYALAIGKIKGRALLLLFFMMAMTLPGEALIYPAYYFFKAVKLYDTLWSVILLEAALSASFGTYLLTSVLKSFDREILEAAMIDGCSKLQLLTRIVFPLTLPSISVLLVFFFVGTWNDFFIPLIMLISSKNYTVPVAMALARAEHNVTVTLQSSAALLGVIPCIIFFVLFQRSLTRGVTAGSIK
ncbi:MAG TPA: carbohydrate ABC transporter permease [Anaerolineales bacterium]|nr:carbohydrate ABC transporter permease [Anaerolineales bacterium]